MRPGALDDISLHPLARPIRSPWTPGETAGSGPWSGRVDDLDGLREHLQCAIELEHTTIPPYLSALYSIDHERNVAATEALLSVFVEEMLHLALAANLLNAVGGRPRLDVAHMMPGYPRPLPHGDPSFEISLLPFGKSAVRQFAQLERPTAKGAPDQSDRYETISQFYNAIRHGLLEVCERVGEATLFCGDPRRQIDEAFSYGGSGRVIAVGDLASALAALDEIVEQGEGASDIEVWDGYRDMFHPERDEVAHYHRMVELMAGRRFRRGDTPASGPTGEAVAVAWNGTTPMRPDQRVADQPPDSPIHALQESFNASYCQLLAQLEVAFNGRPAVLNDAVGAMFSLRAQAEALMQLSIDSGLGTAGPTFEWVPTSDRR